MITGISAAKQAPVAAEPEWTVEELKSGKPMMVYYFVAAVTETGKSPDCTEANYKFARKTEMSAFSNDNVERINKNWVPKKVEIAADADHKVEKNQARVEFWSFTGKRLDSVTLKNQQHLNPSDFEIKLKSREKKSRELADAEIKRITDEEARRKQSETAAK